MSEAEDSSHEAVREGQFARHVSYVVTEAIEMIELIGCNERNAMAAEWPGREMEGFA